MTAVGLCKRPDEHQVAGFVQGDPRDGHVALLALADVPVARRARRQVAGEVAAERLGRAAGRVEEVDQHVPGAGGQVRLLRELALGRLRAGPRRRRRAAPRAAPTGSADGVAVLAHEQHPVLLVERDDPDSAGVHHEFARDACPSRGSTTSRRTSHTSPSNTDSTDDAPGARSSRTVTRCAQPPSRRPAAGRPAVDHVAAPRLLLTASAAAISPANSGCARVGRERNSGMRLGGRRSRGAPHGAARRTRPAARPGDVPEKDSPAASSWPR